jgi:hypothetical protein
MRIHAILAASSSLLLLAAASGACGGGIATTDQGSSGSSGSGTSSGGSQSSGGSDSVGTTSGVNPGGPAQGVSGPTCVVGSQIACPCDGGVNGSKTCLDNGRDYDACSCPVPPPRVCSYPVALNPDGCPAMYSHTIQGTPCTTDGLKCTYYGVGDIGPDGCAGTAELFCAIAPGGALFWGAAQ